MDITTNNNILNFHGLLDLEDSVIFSTKKNINITSEKILYDTLLKNNIDQDYLASCMQTHSNHVAFIEKPGIYKNTDGLIAYFDSKILLKIQSADCVPIFMIDKCERIIGLIHSGWKGTKNSIILSALKIFLKLGSKRKDIEIYIGPFIQDCCYEIKQDVSNLFDKSFIVNKNDKLFLNLLSKIKYDLSENGIISIYESNICTYHNEEYCSYRRDKGITSRMYSVIGKKH
tara:strand:- start:374 stop:1063 length:690 start_codon:yes stop_codon:yes gene_type:complete